MRNEKDLNIIKNRWNNVTESEALTYAISLGMTEYEYISFATFFIWVGKNGEIKDLGSMLNSWCHDSMGDEFKASVLSSALIHEARFFYEYGRKETKEIEKSDGVALVKGYVARDLDNSLWFHFTKPHLENDIELTWWGSTDSSFEIYDHTFPQFKDVTFRGGPVKVEFYMKRIEE